MIELVTLQGNFTDPSILEGEFGLVVIILLIALGWFSMMIRSAEGMVAMLVSLFTLILTLLGAVEELSLFYLVLMASYVILGLAVMFDG